MSLVFLTGCSPANPPVSTTDLYVFRMQPPALVEVNTQNKTPREIPVALPEGCSLDGIFAALMGSSVALELNCSFGQAVVWMDVDSGQVKQPVTDSDSHFMAWAPDGQKAYLKVNSMNLPHVVRVGLDGKSEAVPITELTYDIAPGPAPNGEFLFSFSRGMGLGSEMWQASLDGRIVKQVIADAGSYLSFARWSPDGSRVAFIKIPDSATPFTVGELWVMQADGSQAHKLAEADAGHGFAEAWSPDGSRIAFVVRENPEEAKADRDASALRSNIALIDVRDGTQSVLTHIEGARVEAPEWSPDGNRIAFTGVLDDKMTVYIADVTSGKIETALAAAACCPVWVRK